MIEHLKYRAKLNHLFKEKDSVRNLYQQEIKSIKEKNPEESLQKTQSLESDQNYEESMLDEEISILTTDHILKIAQRRFVETPSHETEGMWMQCNKLSHCYVLTQKGVSELRSSLRRERKEQTELLVMIISALTGIIGAITGLAAVTM